jgi:hypothetical protein
MKPTSTRRVVVESGGVGVVAHVGLHAVGSLADRLDLGAELSSAIPWAGRGVPVYDRGNILVHMSLVLAGGGEACTDIEHLGLSSGLFGSVCSDTTAARVFSEISEGTRASIGLAIARVRERVWSRLPVGTGSDPVVLDIDASLVEIHSENKENAAAHYKGGYGFHPMFCFADATGEMLSGVLRPGNAGANNARDHIRVLDEAIGQLPGPIAVGHRDGDDRGLVDRRLIVRADSAGNTREFLEACKARHVGFFVTARKNTQVSEAVFDAIGVEVWAPALNTVRGPRRQDGKGAVVADLSSLVDLSGFPPGTRFIVRREPRHEGASVTLFESWEYRYHGFYTDQDGDPAELDKMMREHAHVEQHIQRLKDSGLCRFPFRDFNANETWMMTVGLAADLVCWFRLLCLKGPWRNARLKSLRWNLFHIPGRLVRKSRQRIVRIIDGWPAAEVLAEAYRHIAAIA